MTILSLCLCVLTFNRQLLQQGCTKWRLFVWSYVELCLNFTLVRRVGGGEGREGPSGYVVELALKAFLGRQK